MMGIIVISDSDSGGGDNVKFDFLELFSKFGQQVTQIRQTHACDGGEFAK